MRRTDPRHAGRLTAALAVALGLVVAACGGGGKKASTATTTTTSTTESIGVTTTSTEPLGTDASTTTTVGVASPSGTPTTAKGTTATTKKATTSNTVARTNKAVPGGISNVTAAPTTVASASVQPGGTLTYLRAADNPTLDPTGMTTNVGGYGPPAAAIYDVLVYSDPKDGQVKPQTASSLTSSDAVVWTLKIRPNISFTDGTPYDAAAVKFNWQRLQDPNNKALSATQANLMQSMDVVDALTLRITLKAKNAVFPQAMALIPFIGSPTAESAKGTNFGSDPVGAGAFTLKSWTRDSQMVLVRNPKYWNAPLPYLDQIVMKPISDETQRLNTFATGGGDLTYTVVAASATQVKKSGGIEFATVLNGGNTVYFNTRKAPFNDLRARQAVELAIDRNDYAKVVLNGAVEGVDSLFRHDSPFYDPTIVQPPYDAAKAQQLFDQLAADTGGPLQFTIYAFNSAIFPVAAQYIQGVLNNFRNVKAQVGVESIASVVTRTNSGDFNMALGGNFFDDPEPTFTGNYGCASNPSPTGFCSTRFDNDVSDNRLTLDPNQRIADIKDAQKELYAQVPVIYIDRRINWHHATAAVQGIQTFDDGTIFFDRVWMKR